MAAVLAILTTSKTHEKDQSDMFPYFVLGDLLIFVWGEQYLY